MTTMTTRYVRGRASGGGDKWHAVDVAQSPNRYPKALCSVEIGYRTGDFASRPSFDPSDWYSCKRCVRSLEHREETA